jgi:hypothetical protein
LLGVELTEYHHPPSPGNRPHQEIQSLKEQIVQIAERLHADAGGPALYVTVIFGRHGRLSKNRVQAIAKALADAVLFQNVPRSIGDPDVEIPRNLLPQEIAHARAYGSVDGQDKLWHANNGGWVAEIGVPDVQREIDRKQRIVEMARTKCDELWLVIVHNLVRGAPCELSAEARNAEYTFTYDRVIWLNPHQPSAGDFRQRIRTA